MQVTGMDYDVVGKYADNFARLSETFKRVSKVLQAAIAILRASAFMGSFGSAALARYLSGIKPHIDRLAATCAEFESDLRVAIRTHQEADAAAAGEVR
ncbi:MAG: hypothetical protein GTO18_14415 [Anaerolineales bacterium]|nr:hypothetical protein [Anaerolineales bacterium]